jgi:polysaccharide pyruvyl transferase WcaK-like protein
MTAGERPNRRSFLGELFAATMALSAGARSASALAADERPRRLLLRSSWQTVNIGDIGHTPGALKLLETYLPDVEVTLWPSKVDNGVREMLLGAFPKLKIVEGSLGKDGAPKTDALREAWQRSDFLIHGSGPSVVARQHLEAWRKQTAKPYGIYGVTVESMDDGLRDLLSGAAYVFTRDTQSLAFLRREGVTCPLMEFAPDATFAIHLRDDAAATAYLRRAGLEAGAFVCAIPRLRYTPYFKIRGTPPTDEDRRRAAISDRHVATDHSKLREAIVTFVRRTGRKVLACPEMTYEVELAREQLVDPLPADVKPSVVWRDSYWRPDEAGSVYARALAVVSFEMHSPIIAAAMGVPAIYLRQPTDTCKGQMWRDIGLKDWIFEIDDTGPDDIAAAMLDIAGDPAAARAKVSKAMEFVGRRQQETMAVVRTTLTKS